MVLEILTLCFFLLALKEKNFTIKKLSLLDAVVYLFLAVMTLTALLGSDVGQSFWPTQMRSLGVFTWLHFGVWYFFLTQCIETESQWKKLLSWSVQVAVVVGLTGVFQSFLPTVWRGDAGGERFSGILGNPAFFAGFILIHAGIAFFLSTKFLGKWKILFITEGVFFSICVLLSGIRGAALGLAMGVLVFLGTRLFQKSVGKKTKIIKAGIVCLIGLLSISFVVIKNSSLKSDLPGPLARLFDYSLSSGTGATRIMAWNIALKGFAQKPLLGWGWGNFERVFNANYNPQFLQYGFQETVWDKPHNSVLEMMVSMGLFGFLYVLVFVVSLFVLWKQSREKSSHTLGDSLLAATLLAYLGQALFLFETTNVLFPLFLVLAFISVESRLKKEQNFKKVSVPVGVSLVVGGLCVYLLTFNVQFLTTSHAVKTVFDGHTPQNFSSAVEKSLQGNKHLRTESGILIADQFTKLEKSGSLQKENVALWRESALLTAETLEKSFEDSHRQNSITATWSAQVYMILGEFENEKYYDRAIGLLEAAHGIAPQKQEILFLLNRVNLLKKDFVKAASWGQQAVDVNPNIAISYWFLGLAKIAGGDVAAGLVSLDAGFARGYYPTVNERLYIIDLYTDQKQYDKIVEQYKILVVADETNVNWYIKLATAYALAGDKKNALETVNQAKALYPPVAADADAFIQQYHLQ